QSGPRLRQACRQQLEDVSAGAPTGRAPGEIPDGVDRMKPPKCLVSQPISIALSRFCVGIGRL
ncbi:MAG: hypothetical protein AAGE43_05700, partial [Pseudomonadota bacterium]